LNKPCALQRIVSARSDKSLYPLGYYLGDILTYALREHALYLIDQCVYSAVVVIRARLVAGRYILDVHIRKRRALAAYAGADILRRLSSLAAEYRLDNRLAYYLDYKSAYPRRGCYQHVREHCAEVPKG